MTENIETIKLRNEIRTLEILTTLFILIGQFPEKPKCVKYLLDLRYLYICFYNYSNGTK
jgi:hypothetical protein